MEVSLNRMFTYGTNSGHGPFGGEFDEWSSRYGPWRYEVYRTVLQMKVAKDSLATGNTNEE